MVVKLIVPYLFLTLALMAKGLAQDCDDLINTNVDPITGKIGATCASNISLVDSAGDQLTIAPAVRDNQLLITFTITGSSSWCFDKNEITYFIFKDKTQIIYQTLNEFNCDGLSIIKIPANTNSSGQSNEVDQNLKMIAGKIIASIRMKTLHSFVHFDFAKQDSDLFDKQLTCLRQVQSGKSQ
jgi:hypothetical protein